MNRSEAQAVQGDLGGEGSVDQRHDRMNKNRLRGLTWAMSVLVNTKSNVTERHVRVESDGTGRKLSHLTRGDLACESRGEVSRGRSSEDAP
jgi:hypothetical protein